MRDYWWHITIAIFAPLGHFLNAAQFNTKSNLTEDGFLQRVSIRKFGFMFLFLDKKNSPVRWRTYWKYREAQFSFFLYVLIFVTGRIVSGSFDFLTNSFFVYYPFWMILSQVILELGIDIYVTIKKFQKNHQKK